jgi:hypothetical protein
MYELKYFYFAEKSGGNQDFAMFEVERPLQIDIRRFTYAELKLITKRTSSQSLEKEILVLFIMAY